MKNLPDVTLITVDCLHLERSKAAADICQREFNFAKVVILSSVPDPDPRVVYIPKITDGKIYSEFYIKEMYKYIDTPISITYHHDGFILNPSAWDDQFLKYDYMGAPWDHPGAEGLVGNGGFAVRSRRLLEYVAKNYEKIGGPFEPEDLWTSKYARPYLEKEGMTFAPIELARRFSKEGGAHGVVWNDEFAWHGGSYTDISKWMDKNPQYKDTFPWKLDDFTAFMSKYPVYDGTFHVFYSKPIQIQNYKKIASGEKNYDCRIDLDLRNLDLNNIKPGHKIVYTPWRILLSKVGVPTFERKVKSVEKFSSKKELLAKYTDIEITPSFYLPKWKQYLVSIFANIVFPNNRSYTLFQFE